MSGVRGGASPRQQRRGPAPIASFDHDVASFDHDDHRPDSSPESKTAASTSALSEIKEERLAPRIELSRASSSSPQESRDSSPGEFHEDVAELRASTEELAFLDQPLPATSPRGSLSSAVSPTPRLSVVSASSRSPSPHRMILETSFCGPKPIDAELDVTSARIEERLLTTGPAAPPAPPAHDTPPAHTPLTTTTVTTSVATPPVATITTTAITTTITTPCEEKMRKETVNRARAGMRSDGKGRDARRASSAREGRDIVRIRLKPPDQYEDDSSGEEWTPAEPRKPVTLELGNRGRSGERGGARSAGASPARRKSSWSSLFRRDSSSRERPPRRGSVLSLLRSPRRSPPPPAPVPAPAPPRSQEPLILYIPLNPPPGESDPVPVPTPSVALSTSAPPPARIPVPMSSSRSSVSSEVRLQRTVLPDGSIIIPLHSPTERVSSSEDFFPPATLVTSPQTPIIIIEYNKKEEESLEEDISIVKGVVGDHVDDKESQETVVPDTTETSDEMKPVEMNPTPAETIEEGTHEGDLSEVAGSESTSQQRRKRHIVFTTKMGSGEEVFSTQLSITKTPSVSSEMSASSEEAAWEGSWEERAGLVGETREELPWVPTTLPLERPAGLPLVPVRLRRPRSPRPRAPRSPPPPPRAPPPGPAPPPLPPLRVSLPPRRPVWVDVSRVPERRAPPRRIQTLPDPPAPYTYVDPDLCRCECHTHTRHRSNSGDEEVCGETASCSGEQPTRPTTTNIEDVFGDD